MLSALRSPFWWNRSLFQGEFDKLLWKRFIDLKFRMCRWHTVMDPKPLAIIIFAYIDKYHGVQKYLKVRTSDLNWDILVLISFWPWRLLAGVLMSRRLLAAALRPSQIHMGTALGQAVLRMQQRSMTISKEEEEFYRLIRVQEEVQCMSLMSSFNKL